MTIHPLAPTALSKDCTPAPLAPDNIRTSLVDCGTCFNANDYIAAFLDEGDLGVPRDELAAQMQDVSSALAIDTSCDHHAADTARRVTKMFVNEVFVGRYRSVPDVTPSPMFRR